MKISHSSWVAQRRGVSAYSKTALVTALVSVALLSACGQKGPLKLPPVAQLNTTQLNTAQDNAGASHRAHALTDNRPSSAAWQAIWTPPI